MIRSSFFTRLLPRLGALAAAGTLLFLLSGCGWANLHGPQSTFDTAGPVARTQLDLFKVTLYVTTGIFVVVGLVLAYAQIKFRARSEADEHAEPPPQGHGNPLVEIGLIAASVVLLVIIAIPTVRGIWYTHDVPESEKGNAIDVTAIGYQWWFKFEYNGETVQLPTGGEATLVTANELVVPAGTPIRIHLRTVDVIHSFWVPKLAGKVDMIPNRGNFLWLKADHPGYYFGQCAEYCGESHAIMRFRVIALPVHEYVKWLDAQRQGARNVTATALLRESGEIRAKFASLPATGPSAVLAGNTADPFAAWKEKQHPAAGEEVALIAKGKDLFAEKTCLNCHTIRGHASKSGSPYGGITAPDLTHVGSRTSIAAGVLENSSERMADWLRRPEYYKPGNKMVHGIGGMAGYFKYEDGKATPNIVLHEDEIHALVAYLQSLK